MSLGAFSVGDGILSLRSTSAIPWGRGAGLLAGIHGGVFIDRAGEDVRGLRSPAPLAHLQRLPALSAALTGPEPAPPASEALPVSTLSPTAPSWASVRGHLSGSSLPPSLGLAC